MAKMTERQRATNLLEAVLLLLDNVDYVLGNCAPTEMVGAVLPKEILIRVRRILDETRDSNSVFGLKES